jgi:thiamine-phosphate pyrophosphorylase
LLILRHTQSPHRAALALDVARLCRARRIGVIVAGDLGLAVRLRAGLHLPERQARTAGPRIRLWHRAAKRPLTVAAHDRLALRRGRSLGADAALLSPLFPTHSHPGAKGLGLLAFRRLARCAGQPVYALGGVTAHTFRHVRSSGAVGVATVGGLSAGAKRDDSAKDSGPFSR